MLSGMTNDRVIHMFWVVNFILLFPMMVTDFAIGYNYSGTTCAIITNGTFMTLAGWMLIDGYIKLAILTMLSFFSMAAREISNHHMLVVCEGLILRKYYIFLFGWLITAAVIFWGEAYPDGFCDNEFGNYMWAALFIGFISVIVGLIVAQTRGDQPEQRVIVIKNTEMEQMGREQSTGVQQMEQNQ